MIMMGILCFIYLICSIRTNLIFFLIFFTLTPAFCLLAGSYLQAANGDASLSSKLAEASGAFCFVTCLCGWYIFFAIMLASVDFPFDLPRKYRVVQADDLTFANSMQLWTCPPLSREPVRSKRSNTSNKSGIIT